MKKLIMILIMLASIFSGVGVFAGSDSVSVTVSGLSSGTWYTSVTTTVVNNSDEAVKSVQLIIDENLLDKGQFDNDKISWSLPCTNAVSDGKVTLSSDLKTPLTKGNTITLSGGINLAGTAITVNDIKTGYNNHSLDTGKVDYKVAGDIPPSGIAVKIGDKTYQLDSSKENEISIAPGKYEVSVNPVICSESYQYVPSYNQSITIVKEKVNNQTITYKKASVEKKAVQITVGGLTGSADIKVTTQDGYNDTSQTVKNGDSSVNVPVLGICSIIFAQSGEKSPNPSKIAVVKGVVQGDGKVEYSDQPEYVMGCWSMNWSYTPPSEYTYMMYGMVTDLEKLSTGSCSPETTIPPSPNAPDVLWTYGGQFCTPEDYPKSDGIQKIIDVTVNKNWAGVDIDNECSMNITNLGILADKLREKGKSSSYTFLAGAAYVDSKVGQSDVSALKDHCDRFIMMCYADAMWGPSDIDTYVHKAVDVTIYLVGDSKKCILALTTHGLNETNLNKFLDQVTEKNLGGLFVWAPEGMSDNLMNIIKQRLGISTAVNNL